MNGKGDTPRPVDRKKYDANYEHIFGTEAQVRARRQVFISKKQLAKCDIEEGTPILTANHIDVLEHSLAPPKEMVERFRQEAMKPQKPIDLSTPEGWQRLRDANKMSRAKYPKSVGTIIPVDELS